MRNKITAVIACILSLFLTVNVCAQQQLPQRFTVNLVQNGYDGPMGIVFAAAGNSMFSWDKAGHLFVSQWNGTAYVKQTATVLDISEEVGDWRDFGLLSFCLDPGFDQNGLVYLYYVVDRHYLINYGTANYNATVNQYYKATIGRVTRYRLNLGTTITTDYASRKILIGETKKTGVAITHETHAGGSLVFGRDKTLLLSTGDGASPNSTDVGSAPESYYQQALLDTIIRPEENVGAFRSQMVNCLSGKVLRFDPVTGDGIPSNPYYDVSNPRAPKSRVWTLGLRNPFRMTIQPNSGSTNAADANPGTLLIGDVGYSTWEEQEIISTSGLNCGWPLFEGQLANAAYSAGTTVNPDEGQQFKNLCLQPTSFTIDPVVANRRLTHYRPAIAWKHGVRDARVPWFSGATPVDAPVGAAGSPTTGPLFGGNCAIGGVYYTGTTFGTAYQNTYFFADFGTNFIRNANLNTSDPWISNVSNFAPENFTNGVVDLQQNPLDNSLFYVDINTGEIKRISLGNNLPPVCAISSNVISGGSPLMVNFSSAGSTDPNGGSLTYLWDFGDGTTSTVANPSHTFTGTGITSFTVVLTVSNSLTLTSSQSLVISINNTAPVAKINQPANNSTYSILSETDVPLSATVTDNETTAGMQYAWQVILRHNNHEHREPVITGDPTPTVAISPIGCDGETYYYLIELTVTDNGGLVARDSVKIYPDCSMGSVLAVSNLVATPQGNNRSMQLTWTNPVAPYDEIMIAAKPSVGFITNPSGTNYTADASFTGTGTIFEQGVIVYKGTVGQTVTVTNLTEGTKYYFRVFTRTGNRWTGGIETSGTLSAAVTGVTISPLTATIASMGTQQLTALILPANATNQSISFSSSNTAVATVSGSGLVTGVAIGTATITVTTQDGNFTAISTITVTAGGIAVTGVTVSPATTSILLNGTSQLSAVVAPSNANNPAVSWISSNTAVATVSAGGLVTAVSGGTSVITVTTQDGNFTATTTVIVTLPLPGSLTGITSASTAGVNLTTQGTADWAHWPGYDHKSTGNSKISNYVIVGTGTVYTHVDDQRTCTWTDGTPTVSGSNTKGINIPGIGNGFQITAPADQTLRTLKVYLGGYKSVGTLTAKLSDGSSADYVNVNTPVQNAAGQYDGVYTLTYRAASAGQLLTVKWVVTSGTNVTFQGATLVESVPVVYATGITVTPTTATLALSSTKQLSAVIIPANATNQTVSWNSSNTAVATVSTTGLVTAVSAGTATITVTTQDGNYTATSIVTVTPALPGSLTGTTIASTAAVNLTTEGVADWAHWPGYDHKSTGNSKISNYVISGTGTVYTHLDDQRTCTWTDGTPTVSGSNTRGINIPGIGNGFQITAPADQTLRTLKVYLGGYKSVGTLTAKLSDGSSADYVNVNTPVQNAAGQYDGVYTLTYRAASAGQSLTVKWVVSSGTNVTLQGATLVEFPSGSKVITSITKTVTSNSKQQDGDVINKQPLTLYPNPFKNNLVLDYSGKETGEGTITLFNSEMNKIATYPFQKVSPTMTTKINTGGLISGLYFIQLNIGNIKIIKRVIKMQ